MVFSNDNQSAADCKCPVCGIEGDFEASVDAIFCPSCGGIFDLATKAQVADINTPDNPSVYVPFAYDENKAKAEVLKQILSVKHVDKKYADELIRKPWKAVYAPCYIVTCNSAVSLSGRGTFNRGKDLVHESVETVIRFGFRDVPVISVKGISRDMLDDTGDFKLTGARAYEGETSVDGIEVLSSDFVPKENHRKLWSRLDRLMKDVATKQKLDYDEFVPNTGAMITDYSDFKITYALVPLYIVDMPERHYLVNGVTGRITGLDMIPLTPWWQERKMHPDKSRAAIKVIEIIIMSLIGLLGLFIAWKLRFMWPRMAARYCFILAGLMFVFVFLICRVPWVFDKMFKAPKEYIRDDTLIYLNPSAKMTWTKESELIAVTTSDVSADNGSNFFMYLTKIFWPY